MYCFRSFVQNSFYQNIFLLQAVNLLLQRGLHVDEDGLDDSNQQTKRVRMYSMYYIKLMSTQHNTFLEHTRSHPWCIKKHQYLMRTCTCKWTDDYYTYTQYVASSIGTLSAQLSVWPLNPNLVDFMMLRVERFRVAEGVIAELHVTLHIHLHLQCMCESGSRRLSHAKSDLFSRHRSCDKGFSHPLLQWGSKVIRLIAHSMRREPGDNPMWYVHAQISYRIGKFSLCHYWHAVATASSPPSILHPAAAVVTLNSVPVAEYPVLMPHTHTDSTG